MKQEDTLAQMLALRADGFSYPQIATILHKAPSTVYNALAPHVPAVHDVRVRQAADLRASGLCWADVAAQCGYRNAATARAAVYRRERAAQRPAQLSPSLWTKIDAP